MVQYLKARLYSESRGTLSGEVLIFKLRSVLGHARFMLVSNHSGVMLETAALKAKASGVSDLR